MKNLLFFDKNRMGLVPQKNRTLGTVLVLEIRPSSSLISGKPIWNHPLTAS